jgi:hypothetical protein
VVVLVALLAVPLGQAIFRTAVPWPRPDFREPVAFVLGPGGDGAPISGDHWELLYYTRHEPDRYFPLAEIAHRRPARVWVLTGTDPGVAEAVLSQVPPDWQKVDSRTFAGTVAIRMERRP